MLALVLAALAAPGVALADNCGDLADCWSDVLKASLAVAGAALVVGIPMLSMSSSPDDDGDDPDDAPPSPPDGPPDLPQSRFPQSNAYEPGGVNSRL